MDVGAIVGQLLDGQRICIVAPRLDDLPALLDWLVDAVPDDLRGSLQVHRANDRQQIRDASGGRIVFRSARSRHRLRGLELDRVVILQGRADPAGVDRLLEMAWPAVVARRGSVGLLESVQV